MTRAGLAASLLVAVGALALACDVSAWPPRRRPRAPPALTPAGAPEASASAGDHLRLGAPVDASPQDELPLSHAQWAASYNRFRNDPNWVAWRLRADDLGRVGRTQRFFSPDPTLPEGVYRVAHHDYSGSGFDHGHLCPSGQRTARVDDNAATFLTSNILPQRHAMNAGAWEALEQWAVARARSGADVYTVAGGVFPAGCETDRDARGNLPSPACPTVGHGPDPARRVAVPSSMWKVLVVLPRDAGPEAVTASTTVVAVDMPNVDDPDPDWRRHLTTLAALERRTGYRLLTAVPARVRASLASHVYRGP